jgi:hypothetical protein
MRINYGKNFKIQQYHMALHNGKGTAKKFDAVIVCDTGNYLTKYSCLAHMEDVWAKN